MTPAAGNVPDAATGTASATASATAPATVAPSGLDGLEPAWSRLVTAADADGVPRTWHVLDTGADPAARGTVVCVHGNPTWSYAFRGLLAAPPDGWRVVAPDHLDLGFSERTGTHRPLARRIDDLDRVLTALELTGPVVLVAHDWGGPIALGWALRQDAVAGLLLTNTAVHQPEGSPAPALIRAARRRGVLDAVAVRSTGFIRGALALSRPAVPARVRAGYLAPYGTPDRRTAIAGFVRDIPLEPDHPSAATLHAIAAGLPALAAVPTLLLWGPSDPVFSDRYLHDLAARLPQAAVHRVEGASHLTPEDTDLAGALRTFVARAVAPGGTAADAPAPSDAEVAAGERRPLWTRLADPDIADLDAIVEPPAHAGAGPRRVTFGQLARDVDALAVGLRAHGVAPGDRVACLVTPGRELATLLAACWRLGAVVVIADAGLGPAGLSRALRSAAPDHLVGIPRALAAATALRWPGRRIAAGEAPGALRQASGAEVSLAELIVRGAADLADGADPAAVLPEPPAADAPAAIAFTSGSTGPAKGVAYRHRQLEAQRDALVRTYGLSPADRLVAAFAPFALYGPLMGLTSMVPDMDVTAPATLTATALADAVAAIDATLVFASPAALTNVVATADGVDGPGRAALGGVRLLLSAGAPVPAELLRACTALFPTAQAHTPYGMTEVLPVADIDLDTIEAVGPGPGVCVGHPVPGVAVAISTLDADAAATGALTTEPDRTGEVCVRAAHVKDRYDRLALTEWAAAREPGWHRSGDVGHLDADGRLWIEGRLAHIITTAAGVVTPVGIERRVEGIPHVAMAAAVGVGPPHTQQVVVVVATDPAPRRAQLAPLSLVDRVRAAVAEVAHVVGPDGQPIAGAHLDVAAVIAVPSLPVDIRHQSKIDRARVAREAAALLRGRGLPGRDPGHEDDR